jgi:hydrogenase nickel incorporation protein HypB
MSEDIRTIEIHENILASNEDEAEALRNFLSEKKIFMLNVMSSPGSGKTTALSAVINLLKDKIKIGLMNVDIKTSLDCQKVSDLTGVRTLQINNCGLCHIDADMTMRAVHEFDIDDLDLIILENIGNLVCPAEFDTGAHKNMMILSVPEGDDKPLKYPLMFSVCDLVLISKIDTMPYFDFDLDKAIANIKALNPNAEILPVSAKTGEGIDKFAKWILSNQSKMI